MRTDNLSYTSFLKVPGTPLLTRADSTCFIVVANLLYTTGDITMWRTKYILDTSLTTLALLSHSRLLRHTRHSVSTSRISLQW